VLQLHGYKADNDGVKASQSILRNLAITLGTLMLLLAILFLLVSFSREQSTAFIYTDFTVPIASETSPPGQDTQNHRYVVDRHVVLMGQSFSLITGVYWDSYFLWPDLYVHNNMRSEDPDLIFPDEIIDIYNRLGTGSTYTQTERTLIMDAYIKVYDRFKALGPYKNSSAWALLWCGAKFDENFLDNYSHRIDPDDLAIAKRYVDEEGYLD